MFDNLDVRPASAPGGVHRYCVLDGEKEIGYMCYFSNAFIFQFISQTPKNLFEMNDAELKKTFEEIFSKIKKLEEK